MALIEVYHVVSSQYPVDTSSTDDIRPGQLVTLNTSGRVQVADGDNASIYPIGIAADARSTGVTAYTPESGTSLSRNPKTSLTGSLVIGASNVGGAGRRFTQPHVSDNYNEVQASGKMTVYHSGGEFMTDQYEIIRSNGTTVCTYTPGIRLFCSGVETAGGSTLGEPESAIEGRFTDEVGGAGPGSLVCGYVLKGPFAYPSGVPGTDVGTYSGLGGGEGGNSLSLGTFLHLKLSI